MEVRPTGVATGVSRLPWGKWPWHEDSLTNPGKVLFLPRSWPRGKTGS